MENRKNPNFVYLRGNLGRDPELRTFAASSKAVFSLCVNRKWTGNDGKEGEEVLWIDCEAWGERAERVMAELSKGNYIELEGSLHLDTWDDKTTGQKRSKHYIKLYDFQVPERVEGTTPTVSGAEGPEKKKRGRPKGKANTPATAVVGEENSDTNEIPF